MTKIETFDKIEKWFLELASYGDNKKIVLCGNKSDLNNHQVNTKEAKKLAEKFEAQFFLTSALNDKNINEAFYNLAIGTQFY